MMFFINIRRTLFNFHTSKCFNKRPVCYFITHERILPCSGSRMCAGANREEATDTYLGILKALKGTGKKQLHDSQMTDHITKGGG